MPSPTPIACSLSATQLPVRLAEMAALGRDALLDSRSDRTRAQLRFAARAHVRERVDAVVAAEGRCCAFLAMEVREEHDAVVLTIVAPEGAEPVLSELVDAFAAGRPAAAAPAGSP